MGVIPDIILETETHIYNIEMQVKNEKNIIDRMVNNASVLNINLIEAGDFVVNGKRANVISICMFDFFNKNNFIYRSELLIKNLNYRKVSDKFNFYVVNALY